MQRCRAITLISMRFPDDSRVLLGRLRSAPAGAAGFHVGLALDPQPTPNLGRTALRLALRLGRAFQSARRAVVKTFATLRTGAVADFRLALAPVRLALVAAVAGPVGGIATHLAQALLAIAAVAFFQADAIALALPAVVLAIAVAPVAQIDTVVATTRTVSPR